MVSKTNRGTLIQREPYAELETAYALREKAEYVINNWDCDWQAVEAYHAALLESHDFFKPAGIGTAQRYTTIFSISENETDSPL